MDVHKYYQGAISNSVNQIHCKVFPYRRCGHGEDRWFKLWNFYETYKLKPRRCTISVDWNFRLRNKWAMLVINANWTMIRNNGYHPYMILSVWSWWLLPYILVQIYKTNCAKFCRNTTFVIIRCWQFMVPGNWYDLSNGCDGILIGILQTTTIAECKNWYILILNWD